MHIVPRLFLSLLVSNIFLLSGCSKAKDSHTYEPQEGDVIFQSFPHGELTDVIEGATHSPFSHCGLVIKKTHGWYVLEAIQPVIDTPLKEWIKRGREEGYAVYRLKENYHSKIQQFREAAEKFIGRSYDIHYAMDDEKIYCSELVYKAFYNTTGEQLGRVRKLGELNWQPHEQFIRGIENGNLPLDREMITPKDLSEAPQLEPIYREKI